MDMQRKFHDFWKRLGASGDADAKFASIAALYGAPHRRYHTLDHVEQCLIAFDPARRLVARPDAVEAAIWLHDAVIADVHSTPDFSRKEVFDSADFAERFLVEGTGLHQEFGDRVAQLIRVTWRHDPDDDADAQVLVDVDLSILGMPRDAFDAYDANIRKEFADVADKTFVPKRIAVLKRFLARERIYVTDHFDRRYGGQAKSNLKHAIARLERMPCT